MKIFVLIFIVFTFRTSFIWAQESLSNVIDPITSIKELIKSGQLTKKRGEVVKQVKGASVVWANYALIRRDFPHLKGSSNEAIDLWLVDNVAFMLNS